MPVLDTERASIDTGESEHLIFLHGNPTSFSLAGTTSFLASKCWAAALLLIWWVWVDRGMNSQQSHSLIEHVCFGGRYNDYQDLQAMLEDEHRRGAKVVYCLGNLGGFEPHSDRVFPLLWEHEIICMQGNDDHSISNRLTDCACGSTDRRDNDYAQIRYGCTFAKCNPGLPPGSVSLNRYQIRYNT
jgi:hypothetical protein